MRAGALVFAVLFLFQLADAGYVRGYEKAKGIVFSEMPSLAKLPLEIDRPTRYVTEEELDSKVGRAVKLDDLVLAAALGVVTQEGAKSNDILKRMPAIVKALFGERGKLLFPYALPAFLLLSQDIKKQEEAQRSALEIALKDVVYYLMVTGDYSHEVLSKARSCVRQYVSSTALLEYLGSLPPLSSAGVVSCSKDVLKMIRGELDA